MSKCFRDGVAGKSLQGNILVEDAREIKIRDKVDVLVCGGGPAGVGAAIAAARDGVKVLLLERFGMLGGMWTIGLVNPYFSWQGKGMVVESLKNRLEDAGAWKTWKFAHTFDGEVMRLTLEQMMNECGAGFQYFTLVTDAIVIDGAVKGVVTESKAGREAILADVVIDATGDGDVAARAGCRFELGREEDGGVQPVTLMFEISGAGGYLQEDTFSLYDSLAKILSEQEKEEVMPFGRVNNVPWIITCPSGLSAVQHTHVYRVNPLDPADLTRAMKDGRLMAHRATEALRKLPGFENIKITQTASAPGVRESRRILGRNKVTFADTQNGTRFDDAVVFSSFGLDVHDPAPGSKIESNNGRGKPQAFEIPYGCLIPEDVEGLLVSGRCISGDHLAHSSYRVTGTVMGMGLAAGLAAAIAHKEGVLPSAVSGVALHGELERRGVSFLPR